VLLLAPCRCGWNYDSISVKQSAGRLRDNQPMLWAAKRGDSRMKTRSMPEPTFPLRSPQAGSTTSTSSGQALLTGAGGLQCLCLKSTCWRMELLSVASASKP